MNLDPRPAGSPVEVMVATMLSALPDSSAVRYASKLGFEGLGEAGVDLDDSEVRLALLTLRDQFLRTSPPGSFRRRLVESFGFPWNELQTGLRREAETSSFLDDNFDAWLSSEPLNGFTQYSARVLAGANPVFLRTALREAGWTGSWQSWLMSSDADTVWQFIRSYAAAPDIHHTLAQLLDALREQRRPA